MMMKRGMVDKQGKSMVASYRYLGVSNQGAMMSVMFPISMAPGPNSSISGIPALYYSQV